MTATPDIFVTLAQGGLVPVVEIDDAADAVTLARTLVEAGLPVLEVTLRTPAALEAIHRVATECAAMHIGAGTILGPDMVAAAKDAGAQFGVSPGLSLPTLTAATAHDLPFIPGVVTPTEACAAVEHGARHLKFFPAAAYGGPDTLAALAAPLAATGVRFMPTGGVTAANARDYLQLTSVFAVGGTWIAPRADIVAGRWSDIAARAELAVAHARDVLQEAGS